MSRGLALHSAVVPGLTRDPYPPANVVKRDGRPACATTSPCGYGSRVKPGTTAVMTRDRAHIELRTTSHSRGRHCPGDAGLAHPHQVGGRREGQASADACGPPAKKMQAAGTTGAAGKRPAFPARWSSRLYAVCLVHRACWPPCAQCASSTLCGTPASGCQHAATSRPRHAVRPRIREDTLRHVAATAPRLACRDDRAQRPSEVRRDALIKSQFLNFVKINLPDGHSAHGAHAASLADGSR